MHNISYRKEVLIQTEQSLYERNIYLIRIFSRISKIFYSNWFFLHKLVKYDLEIIELLKSKEISILVLSSLILFPFVGGDVFAQSDQVLTVTTEKEAYAAGESVVILGLVEIKLGDMQAIIQVMNPMGNRVAIAQVDITNEGAFSETIATSIGGLWKEDGTYTIQVNYGDNSVQTEFDYGGMMSAGVQTTPEYSVVEEEKLSQTIAIEDNAVDYDITCAEILNSRNIRENPVNSIERYLKDNVYAGLEPRFMGVPVVTSTSMTAGEFIVGNFAQSAQLWVRENVNVEFFEQDSDNVQKNFITVRVQERIALTTYLPNGLCRGVFATVKGELD